MPIRPALCLRVEPGVRAIQFGAFMGYPAGASLWAGIELLDWCFAGDWT